MTEIKPTAEHLQDPYVLQLLEALAKQTDEIEGLEELFQEADADCANKEDIIKEFEGVINTTRIDNYICIDVDELFVSELKWIIDNSTEDMIKADREYWERMSGAAEVLLEAYIVK